MSAPRSCCHRRRGRNGEDAACAPCAAGATPPERGPPRNLSDPAMAGSLFGGWLATLAALRPSEAAARDGWRCTAEPTCHSPDFGCKTCAPKKGAAAAPAKKAAPRRAAATSALGKGKGTGGDSAAHAAARQEAASRKGLLSNLRSQVGQ